MFSYRWTRHRVFDASGNDKKGHAAISMWWIARAAAEEDLARLAIHVGMDKTVSDSP